MTSQYGPEQSTVLATDQRNWATNVFLQSRPVATPELNLVNQLGSTKAQEAVALNTPSGFLVQGSSILVDNIITGLSNAKSGDLVFSPQVPNSFYLAAKNNTNLAVVNGWVINVTGTKILTDNGQDNLIELSDTTVSPSFVFLEVYQQLVDYNSSIKKNGNVDALDVTNDLLISNIGMETSKRVQIKYRIRVVATNLDLNNYADGFNPAVTAFGAQSSDTGYAFTNMAAYGDAGLWRAGAGTSESATELGTVDGYSYAIPMFAVFRREPSTAFSTDSLGSLYLAGSLSDGNSFRPDRLFADVVYPQDVVDLRHLVGTAANDLQDVGNATLRGIAKGTLSTKKGRILDESGAYSEAPGGDMLIKYDLLVSSGNTSSGPRMGMLNNDVPRRAFCNQQVVVYNNIVAIDSSEWLPPETPGPYIHKNIDLSVYFTATGKVKSVDLTNVLMYSDTKWYSLTGGTKFTASFDYATQILRVGKIGNPGERVYFKFDMTLENNGTYGFTDVPTSVIEERYFPTGSSTPHINATKANPVDLFKRDPMYTVSDRIVCAGLEYGDKSSFGMIAELNTAIDQNSFVASLPFGGTVLPGTNQAVLGVRSVQCKMADGSLSDYLNFNFTMDSVTGDVVISGVSIPYGYTNDILVTVYLGTKFSKTSNEGRGIIETYETSFVPVSLVSGFTYKLETASATTTANKKTLVGICSKLVGPVSNPASTPYVLTKPAAGTMYTMVPASSALASLQNNMPIVSLPSPASAGFTCTTATWNQGNSIGIITDTIVAGVHTLSWLEATEKAALVYNTRGYQGVMPVSQTYVTVLGEGPAIISTNGSASPVEKTYVSGTVSITGNNTIRLSGVNLTGTQIINGDLFVIGASPYYGYKVYGTSLDGADTLVTVYDSILIDGTFSDTYFVRRGVSQFQSANIVDRMPSGFEDSYAFGIVPTSASLKGGLPSLYTKPALVGIDPVTAGKDKVILGPPTATLAVRGRFGILVDTGDSVVPPSLFYETVESGTPYKIIQSYIVKEMVSGKVYLAVQSSRFSSGSGLPMTSADTTDDALDLFELKGRVLLRD